MENGTRQEQKMTLARFKVPHLHPPPLAPLPAAAVPAANKGRSAAIGSYDNDVVWRVWHGLLCVSGSHHGAHTKHSCSVWPVVGGAGIGAPCLGAQQTQQFFQTREQVQPFMHCGCGKQPWHPARAPAKSGGRPPDREGLQQRARSWGLVQAIVAGPNTTKLPVPYGCLTGKRALRGIVPPMTRASRGR